MREFDNDLLLEVKRLTEFEGDKLRCVTGAVYATVFLGKMPIKEDLATYLGVSKRMVMDTLKGVPIYSLATKMALSGLYINAEQEPIERIIAREFLASMIDPNDIETAKEYIGFDIALEYLWRIVDSADDTISEYVRSRFEPGLKIPSRLQAFALVVYKDNPHFVSSDYEYIFDRLSDGAWFAREKRLCDGSVNNAKARLATMIVEDRKNA